MHSVLHVQASIYAAVYEIHTAPQGELVTAVLSPDKSLNSPGCGIFSNRGHHGMRLRIGACKEAAN